jgi:hypothetical protein
MHDQTQPATKAQSASPDADAFVAKFCQFWSAPSAADMTRLLTEDVVLVQPLSRPMRGLAAAQAKFSRIFAWVPDMRAEVDAWSSSGALLFIEFRLSGSYGKKRVVWHAVDRLRLRGAFACERVSYFDPSPILRAVARQPTAWLDVLRSGVLRG